MTSISDHSTHGANARSQSPIACANTGASCSNSRPMPIHCAPWPGNTNTVLPTEVARPTTTPAPGSPSANPANPCSNAARSGPTITARCSKVDRRANEKATSPASKPSSAPTQASNRAAWAATADPDLPETTHATTPPDGSEPPIFSTDSTSGACSKITCAFVPLIPNEDTPARRGCPSTGHSRGCASTSTAPTDQSTCGDGASTCKLAGITPWRIAATILITPATPAAA